jgi:hypothetical protein
MSTPEFKSKRGDLLRRCFDFVFTYENKKGEILDYWITFYDTLKYSPQEFYERIEKELEARRVPGMGIAREEFAEGGLLSEKRIYLRLFRERLAVYACASPFGAGYFFSCRVVYVEALIRLWHIVATLFVFTILGVILIPLLGLPFAVIALSALPFALAGVVHNISKSVYSDLDTFLLKIPGLSTIYEALFRADTYYRADARGFYLKQIPTLINELAQEITAGNGAKLVQHYRYPPINKDLQRVLPPSAEPEE